MYNVFFWRERGGGDQLTVNKSFVNIKLNHPATDKSYSSDSIKINLNDYTCIFMSVLMPSELVHLFILICISSMSIRR